MPLDFVKKPINPIDANKFTVVSLFAGGGGSSLGYKWAGGKVLAAVEYDPNAVNTYRMNHYNTHVVHKDIYDVSSDDLLELTGLHLGELDILDGSPPCQGFSTFGNAKFTDSRNKLYKEYVRILRGLQPKCFVMENVSGLNKGKMKPIFQQMLLDLAESGYQVDCKLMNTMYFGVPQNRSRLIFIGVRNDLNAKPCYPIEKKEVITLREAIASVYSSDSYIEHSRYKDTTIAYKLLAQMKEGEKGRKYHPAHKMYGLVRLRWDKPSTTVLRSDGAKGSSCLTCHPTENRKLTIPEIARVTSYPDDFKFAGSYAQQWATIGNSVPPRFMQAVAEEIYTNILSKVEVKEYASSK